MGVISFRVPQEGLDQFAKAVDLISLIREIVQNPNVGKTVDELSKKLSLAQELSQETKDEALAAQEIITQAHEATDELMKATAEHNLKIKNDLSDIETMRNALQTQQDKLAEDKLNSQKLADKAKQDSEERVANALRLQNEAKATQMANKDQEKLIADQLAKLEQDKADFANLQKAAQNDMDRKTAEYISNVEKLALDRSLFDLRKKKFEDALQG